MYLQINDTLRIEDLEERFSACFPQLSIAFYTHPCKPSSSTENRHRVPADKTVGEVRKRGASGAFEIKSWQTVEEVEKTLREVYGLHAKLYRNNPYGSSTPPGSSDRITLKELANPETGAQINGLQKQANKSLADQEPTAEEELITDSTFATVGF